MTRLVKLTYLTLSQRPVRISKVPRKIKNSSTRRVRVIIVGYKKNYTKRCRFYIPSGGWCNSPIIIDATFENGAYEGRNVELYLPPGCSVPSWATSYLVFARQAV